MAKKPAHTQKRPINKIMTNDMGITYAILKYRMPNGHHEVPLPDAEQAMRILRERSSEWGINPNSIGVME